MQLVITKGVGRLLKLMREMFGPQNVNWSKEEGSKIEIVVDAAKAVLDPLTLVRPYHHVI